MFAMANIVNMIIALCGFMISFLTGWAPALLVDHPTVSGVDALKASLAQGKKKLVQNLILFIWIGFLPVIPVMIMGVVLGIVVGFTPLARIPMIGLIMQLFSFAALAAIMPVQTVAYWLAYEDRRAEIHAEATAGGVNLPS
jgi:hypothetical protein